MKYDIVIDKRRIIVAPKIKGINDFRRLNFILDTGASKSIIDCDAAIRLGFDLKRLKIGDKLTTVGGGIHSKILKLPKLSLFGKDMVNFEVNVISLPPPILYFADGLIGMDFLLQFENIKFDFELKTIETSTKDAK
ncbi:MAG: retroviral-like aspartic protease family protein [Lentimicrobiaceae bacterium]|nr:retroviral-like aspartic protease family protein [Lentimicrobiaceae bacterium]